MTRCWRASTGSSRSAEPAGCRGNFYKYIAVLPEGADRARFRKQLAEDHGVRLAGEVYDLPLHRQPVFAEYAIAQGGRDGPSLPVAEDLCARHICLPVHSDMTAGEVDAGLRRGLRRPMTASPESEPKMVFDTSTGVGEHACA